MVEKSYDVVIVGGGIGGGALGAMLARGGKSVLVLEKSVEYQDKVRGEWIAPWGVIEARRAGIYDCLIEAGGHHLKMHVSAGDEFESPEVALAESLDMTALLPGVPGPLCVRHIVACQALVDEAAKHGATVLRGVQGATFEPGSSPAVRFTHNGKEERVSCRLIVGADGRNSVVRAQAGIVEHRDTRHHLFSGMLVDGAFGWPVDTQTKGTEGEVNYLAFPQGGGRVRLYLGYGFERKSLLAGADAQTRFLEAFHLKTLAGSEHLANATPVSHCYSYPNEDTWTEKPFVEGLVLVGDAAGHNDPIIGQGLSITMRDVRTVGEALLGEGTWSSAMFQPYAEERAERMRRLRFAASLTSTIDSEFGPEAQERRKRVRERRRADPTFMLATLAVMVGPETVPPFAFEESYREALLA